MASDITVEILPGVARISREHHLRVLTRPYEQRLVPRQRYGPGIPDL